MEISEKKVGGGVFEKRVDYGPGCKIYYTRMKREIILLLIGGGKSIQQKDIEKAKKLVLDLGGKHD